MNVVGESQLPRLGAERIGEFPSSGDGNVDVGVTPLQKGQGLKQVPVAFDGIQVAHRQQ